MTDAIAELKRLLPLVTPAEHVAPGEWIIDEKTDAFLDAAKNATPELLANADRITELEAEVARLRVGVLQLEQDRWQLSDDLSVARKSLEAAEAEVKKLREDARSAIEAAGYRIVPVEPTEAMVNAAPKPSLDSWGDAAATYRAMIEAASAPKATAPDSASPTGD